jgi:hypothetical protein
VMGTLSSPTFTPFTYSENQLSAHTCAVNVTSALDVVPVTVLAVAVLAVAVLAVVVLAVAVLDTLAAVVDPTVELGFDDVLLLHPINSNVSASVPTTFLRGIMRCLS